jgi:MFS transporter, PAT family, beta-lactamase induction signal transducer AmpG
MTSLQPTIRMSEALTNPPPPDLPGISWRKVGLLTVLYFVQGLPFGFFLFTFPLHLRAEGHSLFKITFLSIVNFPWLIKFLWAPLADRYFWSGLGRRRSWILPAQGGLISALLLTGILTPQLDLIGLMLMLSLVNFFAATQDIGVDGLAVDILDDHERGVGNSVQAAAYKIGMLGGGFGLTFLLKAGVGIEGCFYAMAGAVAVAMLVPIFLRESPPPLIIAEAVQGKNNVGAFGLVLSLFRRHGIVVFLLFVLLIKAGDSIANPLFRLYLKDANFSLGQINWTMNLGGIFATLLGSAVCGFMIMKIGRRAALIITAAGQGLSHLAWAVLGIVGPSMNLVWGAALTEHLVSGMLTVVVFTLMMDTVRREAGSGQYTLLMSIYGGITFALNIIAGGIAQSFGYSVAFSIAGGITLACLVLVWPLSKFGYLDGKRPETL